MLLTFLRTSSQTGQVQSRHTKAALRTARAFQATFLTNDSFAASRINPDVSITHDALSEIVVLKDDTPLPEMPSNQLFVFDALLTDETAVQQALLQSEILILPHDSLEQGREIALQDKNLASKVVLLDPRLPNPIWGQQHLEKFIRHSQTTQN